MKCKACGSETAWAQKKALNKDNQELIPEDEYENLCNTCLSVARECYAGYNVEAGVRDVLLYAYCVFPDFPEFGSELDEVFANYKGSQAVCNIVEG